jgi:hypothetical protein
MYPQAKKVKIKRKATNRTGKFSNAALRERMIAYTQNMNKS